MRFYKQKQLFILLLSLAIVFLTFIVSGCGNDVSSANSPQVQNQASLQSASSSTAVNGDDPAAVVKASIMAYANKDCKQVAALETLRFSNYMYNSKEREIQECEEEVGDVGKMEVKELNTSITNISDDKAGVKATATIDTDGQQISGGFSIYTLIKENGTWKIDDIEGGKTATTTTGKRHRQTPTNSEVAGKYTNQSQSDDVIILKADGGYEHDYTMQADSSEAKVTNIVDTGTYEIEVLQNTGIVSITMNSTKKGNYADECEWYGNFIKEGGDIRFDKS